MKIGILTLPLHTNYGGILQAYALQTVLERMGHEVVVFDTPNKAFRPPLWKRPLCYTKRAILKCQGKVERIFLEHYTDKVRPIIAQRIQPFIEKYINRLEVCKFSKLKSQDYDAIIVGSDQVWRADYFTAWGGQLVQNAFLSFAKDWNIRRISYAASFGIGVCNYSSDEIQLCKEFLNLFDAVSVRESDGVRICKEYFSVDAAHVLDPTMLLSKEDYISLYEKNNTPKSNGTLLNYVLDDTFEIQEIIKKIAWEHSLIPFAVNNPFEKDNTKPLTARIKPSVETWLRGFADADFVVTDSFHACVFSIIFKKQFVVVGNKKRGNARFDSLLKMFGLEDRLVDGSIDFTQLKSINYEEVYKKYKELKFNSIDFLVKNLNG